jgi:hypothetical protein
VVCVAKIDVAALVFDDENEAKFKANKVTVDEVQEVWARWPRYYVNRAERRATHVMVGPTRRGKTLVVPIERWGSTDLWRPTTAFAANPGQVSRYRSGK